MGLEGQFAAYKLSLDEHQKSVAALGKLEHLAAINPKMKSAVDAVAKLYVGSGAPFQRIMKGIENLLEDRTTLGMPVTNDPNFNSIAVRAYSSATDERTRNIAQFHIGNLMADLRKANDNLVFTASLIREKDAVVQAEIAKAIGGPSSTVEAMATGDLTQRFGVERKDEIGGLGGGDRRQLGVDPRPAPAHRRHGKRGRRRGRGHDPGDQFL
jgi:methyl-accepting chemotaxis protein